IKAVESRALRVSLVGATRYFPLLAATWPYFAVRRHAIERYNEKWVEAGNNVSNGPYVVKEWRPDQAMVLEQNPNYWGPRPTITRGEFTLFADPVAQALVAFENDELDQAQVAGADLQRAKADPRLAPLLQVFPRSGTYWVNGDT